MQEEPLTMRSSSARARLGGEDQTAAVSANGRLSSDSPPTRASKRFEVSEDSPRIIVMDGSPADLRLLIDVLSAGAVLLVAPSAEIARQIVAGWLGRDRTFAPGHDVVQCSDLRIDLTEHRADWDGTPLQLTERELQLLATLGSDLGRAWSFRGLVARVWGTTYYGDPTQVRSAIKRLRKKMSMAGAQVDIESVRGLGFRLTAGQSPLSRGGPQGPMSVRSS